MFNKSFPGAKSPIFPQLPGYAILALVNQVISRIDFWDLGKLAKDRVKQFQNDDTWQNVTQLDT